MPTNREASEFARHYKRKAAFLLDENLPPETKEIINVWGYKAIVAVEVGLKSHSDEDILAYAWKHHLVLLTSDSDFLDDRLLPRHRNPGLIVIPSSDVGDDKFIGALHAAVTIIGPFYELYIGAKVTVGQNGEISVSSRDYSSGAIATDRYKLEKNGGILIWENEQ